MGRFTDLIKRTQQIEKIEEVKEEPVVEVQEEAPKKTRKRTKK